MRAVITSLAAGVALLLMADAAVGVPGRGGGGEAEGHAESIPSPSGDGGEVVTHVGVGNSDPGARGSQGPGASDDGGMESSRGLITTHWRDTGIGCPHGEAQGRPVGEDPDGRVYELIRVDRTTDPPTETMIDARCFPQDDPPPVSTPPPRRRQSPR